MFNTIQTYTKRTEGKGQGVPKISFTSHVTRFPQTLLYGPTVKVVLKKIYCVTNYKKGDLPKMSNI